MADKRERILDAALEKFQQFGFLKTTVDEIARQAQVGKGTIYSYFKNKEEVLIALVDREFMRGFAIVAEAMESVDGAMAKLHKMIEVSSAYFHENRLVSKVMAMDQGVALAVISEKNKQFQDISIAGIKDLLEKGMQEGEIKDIDSEKVAYAIDSLIRSFHYLNYLGLEVYKPEEMVAPVMDLLKSGLGKRQKIFSKN